MLCLLLGVPEPGDTGPAVRQFRVEPPGAIRHAQDGQRSMIITEPPQSVRGSGQLPLALPDARQGLCHPVSELGEAGFRG